MRAQSRIFFWGMLISFLGSLPPGVMNIAVINLSINNGTEKALSFAFGSMLSEIIIVRLALISIPWITRKKKLFQFFEILTLILLLILTITSFVTSIRMEEFDSAITVLELSPFLAGAFLSFINPLHIPFWLGWSAVLMEKNILKTGFQSYNIYITGIGIGTMLGFTVFISGSQYVLAVLEEAQLLINWVISFALLITFFMLAKRIMTVPPAIRYKNLNKLP